MSHLTVLIVGIWMGLKWVAPIFLCPAIDREAGAIKWPLGVLFPNVTKQNEKNEDEGQTRSGIENKTALKTGWTEKLTRIPVSLGCCMLTRCIADAEVDSWFSLPFDQLGRKCSLRNRWDWRWIKHFVTVSVYLTKMDPLRAVRLSVSCQHQQQSI